MPAVFSISPELLPDLIELADGRSGGNASKHLLSINWLSPGERRADHAEYRVGITGTAELVQ